MLYTKNSAMSKPGPRNRREGSGREGLKLEENAQINCILESYRAALFQPDLPGIKGPYLGSCLRLNGPAVSLTEH